MSQPVDIGDRKQLFIDNRFIKSSKNVSLIMNPPAKIGPVLLPDRPWESEQLGFCSSVVEVGGIYKMWYRCTSLVGKPGPPFGEGEAFICYAESKDGRNWSKPDLGLIEFASCKDNNIVMKGVLEVVVFYDPHGTPEARYKAVANRYWPDPAKAGIYIHTSPDGIHWNISETRVLPLSPDTANQAMWDTRLGKYVAHIRAWAPPGEVMDPTRRKVARVEMDDILKPRPFKPAQRPYFIWGADKIPVVSTEFPIAFEYDDEDSFSSDHYNSAAVEYQWAQDAYLMFPSFYLHFPSPPVGRLENDGVLDIQLAVSRDGLKYLRLDRQPYIGRGPRGTRDSNSLYMAVGMLRNGQELMHYYAGYSETHGQATFSQPGGSICCAIQRLDGFISADFAHDGGEMVTLKLQFRGNRLFLNVNTLEFGFLKVSILDEDGRELPEYSLEKCDPINGDFVAKVITWQGNHNLSALAGKVVQLRFVGYFSKLYAFQFAD